MLMYISLGFRFS